MTRLFLVFLLFNFLFAKAPDIIWTKFYDNTDYEIAHCVQQTNDGGFVILGSKYGFDRNDPIYSNKHSFYFIKTDSSGDTIWTRRYGGKEGDEGKWVEQTADGGFIVIGHTYSFADSCPDIWVIKTDSLGNVLWSKTYGGREYYYNGVHVEQLMNGDYVLSGNFGETSSYHFKSCLIRIDSIGNVIWNHSFDDIQCINSQSTSDGGFVLAGFTNWQTGPNGSADYCLIRTDSSGQLLWRKTYGGSQSDYGDYVLQTKDGGFIFGGSSWSFGQGNTDFWLIRTDLTGNTIWTKTYGYNTANDFSMLQQTFDEGYILVGNIYSYENYNPNYDIWLVRIDSLGDTLWTRTLDSVRATFNQFPCVQQTSDGGYIVAGYTDIFGSPLGRQIILSRLAPDQIILSKQGKIKVTLLQASANLISDVYLKVPNDILLIENNLINVGTTVDTVYDAGTDLVFSIVIHGPDGDYEHFSNSKFAQVEKLTDTIWEVRFEDLPDSVADWDYNDVVIQVTLDTNTKISSPSDNLILEIDMLSLIGISPNPFNPSTTIRFNLPQRTNTTLTVLDIHGRKVTGLIDNETLQDQHTVQFNAENLPSGIYLFKLHAGEYSAVRRGILLR